MSIRRRDFLAATAALAAAACGQEAAEMPLILPYGPNPMDPRQPIQAKMIPGKLLPQRVYQQPTASPIHLSAAVVLASGSSGAPPVAALKNPMGQDMELLEIKFEVSGASDQTSAIFGGTVWCELTMGTVKITNGSIPLWNFGRAENISGETKTDSTDAKVFTSYSWRLPRPLYIPAGMTVTPKFVHTGYIPTSVNVRIGYSCRTIFNKPKTIYMPWVAKYVSKAFNPLSSAGVDSSSELDLVNPNPEPLYLQRFIGRVMTVIGATKLEGGAAFGAQFLNLKMTDSYGRPIIRNYTAFTSAFSYLTRSWDMDNGASLDPEAYYLVTIKQDAMITGSTAWSGQAFISMVGWRELEMSKEMV